MRKTTAHALSILLVEDSPADALMVQTALSQKSLPLYRLHHVTHLHAALQALAEDAFDVVLLDFTLPDTVGFSGLVQLQTVAPNTPIIVITGAVGGMAEEAMAMAAVEHGAQDWMLKSNINSQSIKRAVQYAVQRKQVENMKSEFVSMVSHELRTPLTSIRGALGLVMGAMAADLPEKTRRLIEIAHTNSERLILLINDILDIDKIASGQMEFTLQAARLAPLLAQAVEANQPYAEKYQVTIALAPVDAALRVQLDAARFLQVMSNLLSNAAKFSPAQGVISVSVTAQSARVRIAVRDQGPGIPDAFRAKIFGRFSQADSSSSRAKGGSGLGLYISKSFVEHMGGEIGFDSTLGRGSVFWVEFALLPAIGEES